MDQEQRWLRDLCPNIIRLESFSSSDGDDVYKIKKLFGNFYETVSHAKVDLHSKIGFLLGRDRLMINFRRLKN